MAKERRLWGIHLSKDSTVAERLSNAVYVQVVRRPPHVSDLKQSIIDLLSYLCSAEGRTDENCTAVDTFFCLAEEWGFDWNHLPEAFQRILGDMGHALHDTLSSPHIAEMLECTPEQLLSKANKIAI